MKPEDTAKLVELFKVTVLPEIRLEMAGARLAAALLNNESPETIKELKAELASLCDEAKRLTSY